MAAVDPQDRSIVIRVVYDGPPEAGKTTSVRALARSFGRSVYTPQEQDGRTVYFDWFEYVGGRFDGAPIRCHVTSVPGQSYWRRRRLKLVDGADVIVFVADTSAVGWDESLAKLRALLRRLQRREGPPVGVIVQANRRDVRGAVSLPVLRAAIAAENVAVVESIATDGTGVREAFVFAVRLALDRVREEQRLGILPQHDLESGPEHMLEMLRALDGAPETSEPEATDTNAQLETSEHADAPGVPSHDLPSGFVWPPVEGRIVLREAATDGARARLDAVGDYEAALAGDWRAHSSATAVFTTLDEARARLIAWAREHASAQSLLSRQRCIALAETGDGRWRLWQVVHRQPSLREWLSANETSGDPQQVQRRVSATLRSIGQARATARAAALALPCTLDTIGVADGVGPRYVGLVRDAAPDAHSDTDESIARDLAALLADRPPNVLDLVRKSIVHSDEIGPSESGIRDHLLRELER